MILGVEGQKAKEFAVSAWSQDAEQHWVLALPDGAFVIDVPNGVYTLQIWVTDDDGAYQSAGWYHGKDGLTVDRSQGLELRVDGKAVEGIEVKLETARQRAEKHLGALLPWFTTPPDQRHSITRDHILNIQLLDANAGDTIVRLPWVADGITEIEWRAIASLAWLVDTDTALAQRVVALPWAADYITDNERLVIAELASLADTDTALGQRIADFPWFSAAPSTQNEGEVIGALAYFANEYPALAQRVADFPWFADDITEAEERGLYSLRGLADTDLALAQRVAALPWFVDGITEVEQGVLAALTADLEMARTWLDGVHDEEAMALMAVLGYARTTNLGGGLVYDDLLDAHFFQKATVSLPLAGEVNLWAFQSEPFPADEDLTAIIQDAVRATEGFMGVRFPATDVILIASHHTGGSLLEGFFTVRREPKTIWIRDTIYHEIGHYYYTFGPRWLVEGGAEFMSFYTYDQAGLESLEDLKPDIWNWVEQTCLKEGISNIHQLNEREFRDPGPPLQCNYSLGSYFLLELYEAVGEDALSATLRELYLEFRDQGHTALEPDEEGRLVFVNEEEFHRVEEVFYQTLLEKTPPDRVEAFLEVYRRLHGGPHGD